MAKIKIKIVYHESASQVLYKRNTWDGDMYKKIYSSSAVAYVDNRLPISIIELIAIENYIMHYNTEDKYYGSGEGDFYDDDFEEFDRTHCISSKELITQLHSFGINEYIEVDEELAHCIEGQNNSIESELSRINNCIKQELNAIQAKWNRLKTKYFENSILTGRILPISDNQHVGSFFCWGVKNSSRTIIDKCLSDPAFSEKQYEQLALEELTDSKIEIVLESISSMTDYNIIHKNLTLLRNYLEKHSKSQDLISKVNAEMYWKDIMTSIKKQDYLKTSDSIYKILQCSNAVKYFAIILNIYNTKNDYYLSLRYDKFWFRHASDISYIREHLSTSLSLALQVPISKFYRNMYEKEMPQDLLEVHWDSAPTVFPKQEWTEDMGIPF